VNTGIASIAGYLRSLGCEILVLDPRLEQLTTKQLAEQILAWTPDFVGYTAASQDICDAAEIAAEVKNARAGVVNVVGGYHASALPTQTLAEFPAFDIAVQGEGEIPFGQLVQGVPPEQVPGIAVRSEAGTPVLTHGDRPLANLDELPMPAWDLFELGRYPHPLLFECVRGCPYNCVYCFHAVGRQVRYKSPERALDEISYCYEKYGVRHMHLGTNGTWPLARQHCAEICEGILARGLKIRWRTSARTDLMDEELIALMRRSGCDSMDIGIESGSAEILRRCQKKTSLPETIRIVRACHEQGIEVELNFLVGLPYENQESMKETYDLVGKLRRYSTLANFALLMPFPGTAVYEMAMKHEGGLRIVSTDWRKYTKQAGRVLKYDHVSQDELEAWRAKLYRHYYFSLRKLFQVLRAPGARRLITPARLLFMLKTPFTSRQRKR